jgi:hypothetical protein
MLFHRLAMGNIIRMVDELRSYWQSSVVLMTQNVIENLTANVISSSLANKSLQTFKKKLEEFDKKFNMEQASRMDKLHCEHDNRAKVTSIDKYSILYVYLW